MKILNKYNYPLLPVPSADETLNKFLKWVKPIVSEKDYSDAEKYVADYLKSDCCKKIQDYLIHKASDKNNSWLSDWWMKFAYLSSRGPVTPECNAPMFFTHPLVEKYSVAEMMALLTHSFVSQYLDYKLNGITDFQVVENPKVKMSMDQIAGIFASFREPNKTIDNYIIAEELIEHITLIKNNVVYKIKVIEDKKVVDYNKIYSAIKHIIENENKSNDVNFNFITGHTDRDKAKILLDDLLKNEKNVKSYNDTIKSIITLTYDENKLSNDAEELKNCLCAPNFNRWHGKSMLWMFNKSKSIGFVGDHTFMDGGSESTLTLRFSQFLDQKPEIKEVDYKQYEELDFDLNSKQKEELSKIFDDYKKYSQKSNIIIKNNKNMNKVMLKNAGVKSVDGFIHTIFQIAQYKTNKQFRNTYVAVDVRNFFRGRTECIRPISEYSKEFAIKYSENKFKSKDEALELLNKIYDEHYSRAKDCKIGHGINRHMLGMTLAFAELNTGEPAPKLFSCEAWNIISGNPISTSSVVSPNIRSAYFDPVHPDGIGIFYAMKPDHFQYSISGWKKDNEYLVNFEKNLEQTINEIVGKLS